MAYLAQPRQVRLVAVEREAMLRQALTLRLELRGCPVERALAAALEARLVPFLAGRHLLRLGMIKPALHVTDDAADDAVADQPAIQLGRDRGNERITVGRVEGGGSVCDGEELRLT